MQENNMMIPGISLCQKWGKIRIFHSTIVALGEPRYISSSAEVCKTTA